MAQIVNLKNQPKKKASADSLSWTAPEFTYQPKGNLWYLISGLIAAGLIVWAVLSNNVFFAILLFFSYLAILFNAQRKPKQIRFEIKPQGVVIDKNLYYFEHLDSFWIFYEPPHLKEISLRSKKTFVPYLKIPLGKTNPVKVRSLLIKYLPEEEHPVSIIDSLGRYLGI